MCIRSLKLDSVIGNISRTLELHCESKSFFLLLGLAWSKIFNTQRLAASVNVNLAWHCSNWILLRSVKHIYSLTRGSRIDRRSNTNIWQTPGDNDLDVSSCPWRLGLSRLTKLLTIIFWEELSSRLDLRSRESRHEKLPKWEHKCSSKTSSLFFRMSTFRKKGKGLHKTTVDYNTHHVTKVSKAIYTGCNCF